MRPEVHAEVERKLDLGEDLPLPSVQQIPGVTEVAAPVSHELEAVYYDTPQLALAAADITLRRRLGGDDAGWHLKLPVAPEHRQEVRLPAGGVDDQVPDALLDAVRVHVRDHDVVPVARILTRRVVRRLLDDHAVVLAELCDDRVSAERWLPDASSTHWRECEVELVCGTGVLLDRLEQALVAGGAEPSAHVSKLSRVLGPAAPVRAPVPPTRKSSTGRVLVQFVADNLRQIEEHDPLVREDTPDAVHKMRVACRRIRSVLATYRPILARNFTDPMRDELKWFAGALGEARDSEVVIERLDALVSEQPVELRLGPVSRRVHLELGDRGRAGREAALDALGSTRYYRLLDQLDRFVETPPLNPRADRRARRELPDLLAAELRRFRTRARAVEDTTDPEARELALHEVRKAAKRLRYAAESAAVVLGAGSTALARLAASAQEILGSHHDSVVARDTLRTLGVQAHLNGENGFTFGRLHAIEEAHAAELDREFFALLEDFPTPKRLRRSLEKQ